MGLTHLDENGNVVMVDVGGKDISLRIAKAQGTIWMSRDAFDAIMSDRVKKGNVLATSKVAAIMAAKNTSSTIPLCHPLPIDQISIEFFPEKGNACIQVQAEVRVSGKTGVEMEAIHAVAIALITIYDMTKAIDRSMVIGEICLCEKSGGKSGQFIREQGKDVTVHGQ
ncbi:MAG: cyclic pyranopterin monophosphate synthase MoaC [Thermodesulfobacteriota bacterium]|nr:cyclic pyranopterin monophosphate synthase MoaC [Thermodesulfobacteriota bacterium]